MSAIKIRDRFSYKVNPVSLKLVKMTKRVKKDKVSELRGVAKILDNLWDGSFYSMGEIASQRIEKEMTYYFGKNWAKDMYRIIDEEPTPIKTLKEL